MCDHLYYIRMITLSFKTLVRVFVIVDDINHMLAVRSHETHISFLSCTPCLQKNCAKFSKNFHNWWKFDKVLSKNNFAQVFFETQCNFNNSNVLLWLFGHHDLNGCNYIFSDIV